MGLLPDTQNCELRMDRECRERFPCHRGLATPTCITAHAWRTCMSGLLTSGFLWSRCRGKSSRHSWHMRNPRIYVSGKRTIFLVWCWFLTEMFVKNGGRQKVTMKSILPFSLQFHYNDGVSNHRHLYCLQLFVQAQIKENIKAQRHWPWWGRFDVIMTLLLRHVPVGLSFYVSASVVSSMMTSSNRNIFRVTAICTGNSQTTGEFPRRRPVTWSLDGFFDLCLYKRLSKQPWGWWLEAPSRSLWRHCNAQKSLAQGGWTENGELSSWWRLCHCWWYWRLSFWQLAVPPVAAELELWRLLGLSMHLCILFVSLFIYRGIVYRYQVTVVREHLSKCCIWC